MERGGRAQNRGFGPAERWVDSSGTTLSGALTYQFTSRVFAGVEGRWLTSFSGADLNEKMGWGVFAGPTMLVKVTDSAALNLAWTPQVSGHASGSAEGRDLDNFERHQFRAAIQNCPTVNARLVRTMNFMKSRRAT